MKAPETRLIEQMIEGVGPWIWLTEDTGAWHGPSLEFTGLRTAIFRHTKRREVVVQAGGCLGMYPRLWSRHFNRVYTFEPDPQNYAVLLRNRDQPNIYSFNAALGEGTEPLRLRRKEMVNVGMHTIVLEDRLDTDIDVQQMRIDDLALDACDVIQLDVEGFEAHALMGGIETITKYRPVISVETCDPTVRNFFEALGYREVERNVADTIFAP